MLPLSFSIYVLCGSGSFIFVLVSDSLLLTPWPCPARGYELFPLIQKTGRLKAYKTPALKLFLSPLTTSALIPMPYTKRASEMAL